MKRLLNLFIFILCITNSNAQIAWNTRAGVGFSTLIVNNHHMGSQLAWKAGVGAEYALWRKNLLVMSAMEYAHKGSQCKDTSGKEYQLTDAHYIQMPVIIAGRLNFKNFNTTLKGGVYAAYAFENNKDAITTDKFDGGYLLSLDIEYLHWVLGVDYQRGLKKLIDEKYYDVYNSALYFNIGYRF